ncbi:hypothetical protein BRADI_3g43155v3 [Brachypodium distachyon]|uniref:Uncharacterized protein n=1 Tax=Brachypodium distachyon TaxID=15368 RepID=A0A2K2D2R8_BRADI|nr:hypothetical protein BRADI_3g43155v3 [Brachypodium distachyon]
MRPRRACCLSASACSSGVLRARRLLRPQAAHWCHGVLRRAPLCGRPRLSWLVHHVRSNESQPDVPPRQPRRGVKFPRPASMRHAFLCLAKLKLLKIKIMLLSFL